MFLVTEIIKNKRDGKENSSEELKFLIESYTRGDIPDYQVSAWLMAVIIQGMTEDETQTMTDLMLHSGSVMDFSNISHSKVDKHSTGGVGDKTSLILGPIVAAAGLAVPMISGRGLGHTGGTLDKLESIPGFNTRLTELEFKKMVEKEGLCFMGQTDSICPADKKLYSLRDVTGTIESYPLICASIMSKKLAEGIDALVLDVKCGSGAFMKTKKDAKILAQNLLRIGKKAKKKMTAVITDMNQPLGQLIGNSLEIEECVAILKNDDSEGVYSDTKELSLELSAHMLRLGGAAKNHKAARELAEKVLANGKAFEKFEKICALQGGKLDALPKDKGEKIVRSEKSGTVASFDCEAIGNAAIMIGAGRKVSSDKIDPTAGFRSLRKIGDKIKKGDPIFIIHTRQTDRMIEVENRLQRSIKIQSGKIIKPRLLIEVLT